MDDPRLFSTQLDYDVPLLRLLAELPGGQGVAGEVRRLFEKKYHRLIPDEHRGSRSGGMIVWDNNVAWSRLRLKQNGFLDMPRRGIWRITDAGRQWLKENSQATRIKRIQRKRPQTPRKRSPAKVAAAPGIDLEMLKQTRKLMPADEFRQVWGTLYDQLLAEERVKSITEITQTELGHRTRRWLDDVHAFLSGKNASHPSSEALCDWIHFCYALELYREAAALFPYVCEDEVDTAIYKRAKRVAKVCRSKIAG